MVRTTKIASGGTHDDGYNVPETQLLPTVVDDQHSQQG